MVQMKKQLTIFTTEEESSVYKNCVFTGHRDLGEDFSKSRLKKTVEALIKAGVTTFYNGMAIGFDLISAETVLSLRKKYPQVKLIACVPCYGQEKYFSDSDKKRYVKILKKADETVTLADHYYNGCMQQRDKYMVDRADVMIAYCNKPTGGAAYTVKLYQKAYPNREIYFI